MAEKMTVGTVGLGLMGCSIATCLLQAGHKVISIVKDPDEEQKARTRILGFLEELKAEELTSFHADELVKNHVITTDINHLAGVEVVIESIVEDLDEKRRLYKDLEKVLSKTAIIGSNTSAIPVSFLQAGLKYPERLLGIHWAEPAHITRFMEVICGDTTDLKYAELIIQLARGWGKEPSLVKKDIRGFISNRIMYAMLREAFQLVEKGYASIEDVDRSLRNDLGYWITFAGPFRFMDLTGIPAYRTVMEDLLPDLSNATTTPLLIKELADSGAKGVSNARGFYSYTPESARLWEKKFVEFSYAIRKLASKYPENTGDI